MNLGETPVDFYNRKIEECTKEAEICFEEGNKYIGKYYLREVDNYKEMLKIYLEH